MRVIRIEEGFMEITPVAQVEYLLYNSVSMNLENFGTQQLGLNSSSPTREAGDGTQVTKKTSDEGFVFRDVSVDCWIFSFERGKTTRGHVFSSFFSGTT